MSYVISNKVTGALHHARTLSMKALPSRGIDKPRVRLPDIVLSSCPKDAVRLIAAFQRNGLYTNAFITSRTGAGSEETEKLAEGTAW
jgi:hypothetical protein